MHTELEASIIESWIKEHILDSEGITDLIINISPKEVSSKTAGVFYGKFQNETNLALAFIGLPEFLEGYPSKTMVNAEYRFKCCQALGEAICKMKIYQIERDHKIESIEHAEEVEKRVEEALKKAQREK